MAYWNCLQSAVLHLMGLCAPSVQAQSVEEARTLLLLLNVYWCLMVIVSNTARLAALPAEPTTKDTSPDLRLFITPYTFLQIQVFLSMTLCCWVNCSRHFKGSSALIFKSQQSSVGLSNPEGKGNIVSRKIGNFSPIVTVSDYWRHQARAKQLREPQKFHDIFSIWSSANKEYQYTSSCTNTGIGYIYALQFTILSAINYQCTTVYLELKCTGQWTDMWGSLMWFQQVTITGITPLMLHK